MGFDGVPRPAQMTPYTDVLNPYTAGNAAKSENAGKPLVQSFKGEQKIKGLQRDERQYHDPDDEDENNRGEIFSEEEAEEILLFARLRGIMNLSLETGKRYEFRVNSDTGLVEFTDVENGEVLLQLTPEELTELSGKIHRYAGMLTDQAG